MKEELQYKNGVAYNERQQKFHGNDMLISVDEMWKAWKHSQVYNWTTDELVTWLTEHVKQPQYADYFRRNLIDGQFLPRLALNENNYYSNVMHIKDPRHRRLIMVKATDLVLFGQQHSMSFVFVFGQFYLQTYLFCCRAIQFDQGHFDDKRPDAVYIFLHLLVFEASSVARSNQTHDCRV